MHCTDISHASLTYFPWMVLISFVGLQLHILLLVSTLPPCFMDAFTSRCAQLPTFEEQAMQAVAAQRAGEHCLTHLYT